MALCKTTVSKVYQEVINEVINQCKDIFSEEGFDEQGAQELKQLWESKLNASKAVSKHTESTEVKNFSKKQEHSSNGTGNVFKLQQVQHQPTLQVLKAPTVGHVAPNNHVQTTILENKLIPLQITLPMQPGSSDAQQKILTIQVPATAMQGNQLHQVLNGPIIPATLNLPPQIASNILQQHVNAAFQNQQQSTTIVTEQLSQMDGCFEGTIANIKNPTCDQITQIILNDISTNYTNNSSPNQVLPDHNNDKKLKNKAPQIKTKIVDNTEMSMQCSSSSISKNSKTYKVKNIMQSTIKKRLMKKLMTQADGHLDTSDDEDGTEDDEEDEEKEEDKDEEDREMEEGRPEEDPLNSEDDVTDEEHADLFETENVIVCQYDKITRSRNRWKFYLKDGIMNLNGEDLIFQKANGDAEW